MNLEEAKYAISQKVQELKNILQQRKIELYTNSDTEEPHLVFNGYSYVESFVNDIEGDMYVSLNELIHLSYLNELSNEKQRLLVESIVRSLEFDQFHEMYMYTEVKDQLDREQVTRLIEFEEAQATIASTIVERLKGEYLSDVKEDLKKLSKITWNGDQLELAELFLQLELNGWINTGNNKSAYYRTLAAMFHIPGKEGTLLSNLQTYFKKDKVTPYGIFKVLPPNKIN